MSAARDTRDRIFAAAAEEFADHGIAGARVDRIAARSEMSKPMIYTYFGSKEALFDAVFRGRVLANLTRVSFSADDLPGYAVRLYDDYVADPALVRLVMWKRLEREPTGYLYEGMREKDESHLREIAQQQEAGIVRADLTADEIWSLLLSFATTWAQNSISTVATAADPEDDHRRRREALASVVRAGLLA